MTRAQRRRLLRRGLLILGRRLALWLLNPLGAAGFMWIALQINAGVSIPLAAFIGVCLVGGPALLQLRRILRFARALADDLRAGEGAVDDGGRIVAPDTRIPLS